jgi:hypothetical protein
MWIFKSHFCINITHFCINFEVIYHFDMRMSQIFGHCDKYNSFYGKIFNGKITRNPCLSSCQKINLCKWKIMSLSDARCPSHSKMVKNLTTDAKMTELLPFKYWHLSLTKFIAKVYMCLVTWHSAYAYW